MARIVAVERNLSIRPVDFGQTPLRVIFVGHAFPVRGRCPDRPQLIVELEADSLMVAGCKVAQFPLGATIKNQAATFGILLTVPGTSRVIVAGQKSGGCAVTILQLIVISSPRHASSVDPVFLS